MATITATLAKSFSPVRSVHAGMNGISAKFNTGARVTSASASQVILLCKLPVGATVVDLHENHSSGAASRPLNFGIRDGRSTSLTAEAIASNVAQAQVNRGGLNLPYTLSATSGELFKYVTCSSADEGAPDASASVQINYTIFYLIDS